MRLKYNIYKYGGNMTKNILAVVVASLASLPLMALEQGDYKFNAFGTLGVSLLNGEDYTQYGTQGQIQDKWTGEQDTKLGGQFSYGLTDKLGLTAQAIIKAEQDSYKTNLEWLYLNYQLQDNWQVRAGRLRTPIYMLSETLDVGYIYPWIRLPDEVYAQIKLSNYEGVDTIYNMNIDQIGALSLQALVGQAKNRDYYAYDEMYKVDYDNILGANAVLSTEIGDFRVGYVESKLSFDNPMFRIKNEKGQFTSLGYKYDNGGLLNYTEWTRRIVSGASNTVDSYYTTFGYHIEKFTPHITYAQASEKNSGSQKSLTYGLSYDLLSNVKLKGEYKRVDTQDGYAGNFVEEGANIRIPNTYDGDIISFAVDFVY